MKIEQVDIDLKRVTITVTWQEARAQPQLRSLHPHCKPMRNFRAGTTLIEVVTGAALSTVVLGGGVMLFLSGNMNWLRGHGHIDAETVSEKLCGWSPESCERRCR